MDFETTNIIQCILGFKTDNPDRHVVLFGVDFTTDSNNNLVETPFERKLHDAQDQPIRITRAKNPGPSVFERALSGEYRGLAPAVLPVLQES